ncbi:MAG: preprotein translocase subunit YajC [Oscillospiraceae bacterium]|nr:preprotein translocase subunit YajC [Oscillospiraceae bacterium]
MQVFAEGEAAAGTADNAAAAPGAGGLLASFLPLVIALVLMWLFLFRPQQKREKEAQKMRDNVRVGDEVCTAGGLVGIVIRITEDTIVIETGGERSKIRVKKWAIHENITQIEEAQAAEKARKAARKTGLAAAGVNTDEKPKKKKSED